MREEEVAAGGIMIRYTNHSVKQDLAKLDNKDVENRNTALCSLKQLVVQLDAITLSRFLNQIAESRETGAARAYAISLYEDVARVHGTNVVPHIPQVINALARSLLASGSSPQMHQTCAKVTAALSRYTIDSTTSTEDAEEILRELSQPLANLVSGKLEPVAGGAAACLQALVETDNWKRASSDLVHEICQRTIAALNEKSTRTVAHMHLIRSLASVNADILSIYGTSLLRAGAEILMLGSSPWQQRMSAAKLLQDVLTILDKETLTSELPFTMQGLESCRLDKTPHVRSAVTEALNTARLLACGDERRTSIGTAASPVLKTPEQARSLRKFGNHPLSPVSKRVASPVYQESRPPLPFSPLSTSKTDSSHVVTRGSFPKSSPGRGARRAPLFPARDQIHQSHGSSSSPASPSSSTTDEGDSEALALDAKENFPSRRSLVNRVASPQYDLGLPGRGLAVRRKNRRSHLPPTPGVNSRSQPSSPLSRSMSKSQGRIEASQLVNSGKPAAGLPVAESTRDCPLPEDAFMSPMDVSFSTSHRADEHAAGEQHSNSTALSFGNEVEVSLPRLRVGNTRIESSESAVQSKYIISCDGADCKTPNPQFPQNQSCLDAASIDTEKNCFQISQSNDNGNEVVENDAFSRESDVKIATTFLNGTSITSALVEGGSPKQTVLNLQAHPYNSLSHLNSEADPEAASALVQKPEMLLTLKDQLPFTTQKLLHVLQPDLQSLDSDVTVSTPDPDVKSCRNVLEESSSLKQAGLEMDFETSSDAGWSVRENPLASDESFHSGESSEEDPDRKSRGLCKAISFPSKVASADRNIYKTSVTLHRKAWSVDGGLLHEGAQNRGVHFRNRDDIGTWRMSPKSIRSVRSFSGVGVSDEICSATGAEPKKLFLEFEAAERPAAEARALEDEDRIGGSTSQTKLSSFGTKDESMITQQCCSCNKIVIKAPVTRESTDNDETRDQLPETSPPEEKAKGWWDHRLGHYFVSRFIKKNWTKVRWYGEMVFVGSLCIIVALPLAMIVTKALSTPRDLSLVPT